MSIVLQDLGCEIVTVDNGRACLTEVRKHPPDLLFLDLRMPKLPGARVLAELRGDPRFADLPVVVVSGSTEVEEAFEHSAANAVLVKPFDVDDLVRVARRYLSGRLPAPPAVLPSQG